QLTGMTLGANTTNYTYDVRGNLKTVTQGANTSTYTWDAADRLKTVSGGGNTSNFSYDHANRRVQKEANGTITNYLWDEFSQFGDVVFEANNSWSVQTNYTLGNGDILGQNKLSTVSYYLKDGQGSVRGLLDSLGNPVSSENYTYDAFGSLKS